MILCLVSCSKEDSKTAIEKNKDTTKSTGTDLVKRKLVYNLSDYFLNDESLNSITDSIFNSLNDNERIAQMIISSCGLLGKSKTYVQKLISEKKIGGVLLLGGSKESFKNIIAEFNSIVKSSHSIPLIYSIDAEPSLINQKISGLRKINTTNSVKSEKEAYQSGEEITKIIKDIGFNQNYAPVCDLEINKEIIGNRSYSSNPKEIISYAKEFIIATQNNNVIATAKHFPGHGNVKGDSHKDLVFINGELKELEIFQDIINSGVISIMVGHIAVQNNKEYSTSGLPASLSKTIVSDLLRKKLSFKGLIITDAMNMKALSKFNSPSLKAIFAGCDMILMPSDEVKLMKSVNDEIIKDKDLKKKVYESVKRIIRVKICLGLF